MNPQEYYYNSIDKSVLSYEEKLFDPSSIIINDKPNDINIRYKNRLITTPIEMGSSGDAMSNGSGNLPGDWWGIVQKMGAWYQQNVHTYQGTREKPRSGRKAYPCDLLGGKNVFDDCSSFVTACVLAMGVQKEAWYKWAPCTSSMQVGSDWDQTLRANGWQYIPFNSSILKPGDIYCGPPATHVEICAGPGKQYGWGSVHDGQGGKPGMPCGTPTNYLTHGKPYQHIWRKT